jgi:hypothetical protein
MLALTARNKIAQIRGLGCQQNEKGANFGHRRVVRLLYNFCNLDRTGSCQQGPLPGLRRAEEGTPRQLSGIYFGFGAVSSSLAVPVPFAFASGAAGRCFFEGGPKYA